MDDMVCKSDWQGFIAGDDDAFGKIYKTYIDQLYAIGKKYHQDSELIKDCIQDVFVNLYKYRSKLNPNVHVLSYLIACLKRNILASIKKDGRMQKIQTDNFHDFYLEWSSESHIIQEEKNSEIYQKLQQLMLQLPARQQEVIYLKFHAELSYEEIATIMDISLATCRTLVYRAIKTLREHVDNVPLIHLLMILFK